MTTNTLSWEQGLDAVPAASGLGRAPASSVAAQGDPRLWRERQIMQDRATWRKS